MAMPRKPGSKAYRDQRRELLIRLGVHGRQLIELVVTDLMRCGRRPREAWRLAWEFTQEEVAMRFSQTRGDPDIRMRGSRICEYEKWPMGGVRPSVRALRILAAVYEITWDRLVDIDDLVEMPASDRQAFLDLCDLRHGDSPEVHLSRQRGYRASGPYGTDDPEVNRPITATNEPMTVTERLTIPLSGRSSERLGGGLPGEVTHFTGRDGSMAKLRARIAEQASQDTVVTIYTIDGMAGVGKTAFARHAARQLTEHYPDGAIWVDLYGHTPGMQPREPFSALEQMLLQLGVPPEAIKANVAERQDQWRHHIHRRRLLIVLDNAGTSDQVLPLLPETPGCLVLITSRRKLTGLTDAYPVSLDVLSWGEAEHLFVELVGKQRCKDRDAVRQVVAACGRLPLAIRLIAGRLRHHRSELVADVAADFADRTGLDTFMAEHLSVRAAFKWSYRLLTDPQRRAFRLLGWHPGPEITPVVIAAVATVSPTQGKRLLRELVDHNLLEQLAVGDVPGGPRYRMHDLVRLYARERADAEELPDERRATVDRLAGSYLTITHEVNRLLRPYAPGGPGKNTAQGTVLTFADASRARTWLTVERHNLLRCVRAASPTTEAADLTTVLANHFRDFGFWSDVRDLYSQALTIYRHLDDRRGEVLALWGLGEVERRIGEYGHAREYHTEALALARRLDYQRGEADALRGLGEVERLVGEYGQARGYHTEALALARHLNYRRAEVEALWGLGEVERRVGEYAQARDYHTQVLALAQHLGDRRGEVEALWGLGEVERLVGEYDQARKYQTQALSLARDLGDRRGEVDALWGLGEVERLVGEYDQARKYHAQALSLARHLGDRFSEVDALWGLGEVEWFVSQYGRAREYYTQALTLARDLGYRRGEVDALRGLGHVERLVGEYGQAREYYTQALSLVRQLGDRLGEFWSLWGLGEVERLVGEYDQAREYHTQALTLAWQLGDRVGEIWSLWGLGEGARLVGEYDQARDYHTRALTLARQLGDRVGEILALRGLGDVGRLVGEYDQARDYHTRALTLARQLGDRLGELMALRGLGDVEQLVGEYDRARDYHTRALTLTRQLAYRRGEAEALRGLGEVERLLGEYDQARDCHTQSLALARQLGDRPGQAEALWKLGHIATGTEERGQASELWRKALEIYEELGVPFADAVRSAMRRL
jgi:tetratricopeptide (TPR) repeat protein/transcriptional regulator with XRE-family HTH domain